MHTWHTDGQIVSDERGCGAKRIVFLFAAQRRRHTINAATALPINAYSMLDVKADLLGLPIAYAST